MVGFVGSLVAFMEARNKSPCSAQSHPSERVVVLGILLQQLGSSVATDTKTGLSSTSRRAL